MATYRFETPVAFDVGPLPADWLPVPRIPYGSPEQRMAAHRRSLPRGRTILLLKDGTCRQVDYPVQMVPAWQEDGDPFTQIGIAGYLYSDIARIFYGGHVDYVNSAEAAQLTTCGYGAGLSQVHWSDLTGDTWESLDTWENPNG
ncbi:MAG TPA: hypothetical protein VGO87_11420 [Acidimicrobiia bacterium]|jgi:Fe-S cluster assembly iron-binding protein IscA